MHCHTRLQNAECKMQNVKKKQKAGLFLFKNRLFSLN